MSKERDLEIALQKEIIIILKDDKFYDEKGDLVNINSYKHILPNNYYGDEHKFAPYVISEVNSSVENNERIEIQVVFTICVCDGIKEGVENINKNIHCEDDLFHIESKIKERFKKNSILDDKYICMNDWQFALVNDNTAPIYYAALAVKFQATIIETEEGYKENLL